jgi:hypothetical protein
MQLQNSSCTSALVRVLFASLATNLEKRQMNNKASIAELIAELSAHPVVTQRAIDLALALGVRLNIANGVGA